MARILAVGDFGHSGLSEAIRAPLHHFHESGHEIWQLAYGYSGWLPAIDRKEYPWAERVLRSGDFGQSTLGAALSLCVPQVVLTSLDCWMVAHLAGVRHKDTKSDEAWAAMDLPTRKFKHIAYYPMDGLIDDAYYPEEVAKLVRVLEYPVTYSRYAQRAALRKPVERDVPFIPICHDPKVYYPGDKIGARQALSIPEGDFVVGMVGTNQYRKRWDEFIYACGEFARGKKDVTILPWTTWDKDILHGWKIRDLIHRAGLDAKVMNPGRFVGQLSEEGMAALYNAMDVCVLTTIGEG